MEDKAYYIYKPFFIKNIPSNKRLKHRIETEHDINGTFAGLLWSMANSYTEDLLKKINSKNHIQNCDGNKILITNNNFDEVHNAFINYFLELINFYEKNPGLQYVLGQYPTVGFINPFLDSFKVKNNNLSFGCDINLIALKFIEELLQGRRLNLDFDCRYFSSKQNDYRNLYYANLDLSHHEEWKKVYSGLLPFTRNPSTVISELAEQLRDKCQHYSGYKNNPILPFTSILNDKQAKDLSELLVKFIAVPETNPQVFFNLFRNKAIIVPEDELALSADNPNVFPQIKIKKDYIGYLCFLLEYLRHKGLLKHDKRGFWESLEKHSIFLGYNKDGYKPISHKSLSARCTNIWTKYYMYNSKGTKNYKAIEFAKLLNRINEIIDQDKPTEFDLRIDEILNKIEIQSDLKECYKLIVEIYEFYR